MKSVLALMLLLGDGDALAPWAARRQAGDQDRSHVQEIDAAKAAYVVVQGGTVDGRSCRTPLGVGMNREGACEQTWESNRSVRMENVGVADVVNPWLSNGRNGFRSLPEIVASLTEPGMSDRERATALWYGWSRHQFHFGGGDARGEADPVRVLNVYGYNTCGHDSMSLSALWKQAGLKAAPARGVGHCIPQVFYDGRWNLFDGDLHAVYLLRDNETVANDRDLARDHDLVKRSHTLGLLMPRARATEEYEAGMYVYDGEITGDRDGYKEGSMKMLLRPGEALVWRWGHLEPVKYNGGNRGQLYPDRVCNGLWEYRPDFTKDLWKKGALSVEGIRSTPEGPAAEEGKTGTVVWALQSPYPFVGGRVDVDGAGVEVSHSWDGKDWKPFADALFAYTPQSPEPRHRYLLRCRLEGSARLRRLAIVNDLQMAPLTLPEMAVGKNAFTYTDESPGERQVRITHRWVERSSTRPPAAPAAPQHPADRGEVAGTDVVFAWTPSVDPDGDAIADYQFELSNRADMRWPLSMGFCTLISRTGDKGKARFALGEPGLLTADRTYYWRVRAKDAKGVWGPWSATWSFTPRGPNHPLDPAIDAGVLRWKPNPTGRRPALYRVYGSDEQGFSVSDAPYAVVTGISKELKSPFPANFLAEVRGTEFPLLGKADVRGYYRVVAVDEAGKRSGPSDFVAAPRPLLYSVPVGAAKVGAPYRYEVKSNRSIGDLRFRQLQGRDTANFWDVEAFRFALEKGPAWLSIDPATGVLSGTPAAAGTAEVAVSVTLEREVRVLDPKVLAWGNEKVLSTSVERLGPATQRFTVRVEP